MIIKIKNFARKIQRYKKNTLSKIRTNLNYLNHKKVVPRHLFYGQLNKLRSVEMLDELNKQIALYKKHGKSKFVFVEIGNYLGESLELFGEQIHNNLKDNYLIVSIDPYIPYTSQEEEKQNKSPTPMMMKDKIIKKIEDSLRNAFDIKFAFNKYVVGEEFCIKNLKLKSDNLNDISFDMLSHLGFTKNEIEIANIHCCGSMTLENAPHLKDKDLPIFDCANPCGRIGKRSSFK